MPAHPKLPDKAVLVEIIDEKNNCILLIRNAEGISEGLWNGLGGKIEESETPFQAANREVFEESRLTVKTLTYHGTLTIFLSNAVSPSLIVYVFSTNDFNGRVRGNGKDILNWFPLDGLPYATMWQDDFFWLPYLLKGRKWVNGQFEYGTDNLLRVAEILPMPEGEDFNGKVKKSVGLP